MKQCDSEDDDDGDDINVINESMLYQCINFVVCITFNMTALPFWGIGELDFASLVAPEYWIGLEIPNEAI